MAAVTVDDRTDAVFGNLRIITAQVDIANDADTWDTNLKQILFATANSQAAGNNSIGCTVSGDTITFQTAGAETNALVFVVGR